MSVAALLQTYAVISSEMQGLPILRRKRVIAIIVVVSALSLLVAWDVHRLRLQTASGYDGGIVEVRKYDGRSGVFRVLYSRLRDADEANALIAARSNLPYDEQRLVEDADDEADGHGKAKAKSSRATVIPSMKFRPLTESPQREDEVDEKSSEEEESPRRRTPPHLPQESHSAPVRARPKNQTLETDIDALLNPPNSWVSNTQRQRNTMEAIKKLLYYNETESAEALWVAAQSQHSSERKSSLNTDDDRVVTETPKSEEEEFSVSSSMTWPVPQFTRVDVLECQWVEDLKRYLQGITERRQVSVVTANLEHIEVVLNWLISAVTVAKFSLRNILVLSLSTELHEFLVSKKMNSIYVSPTDVISTSGLKHITTAFNQIHIVRLTLFRLMSHWNYDVVMYDSDAVVLRNPQPLFDASPGVELIGSSGKGPQSIGNVWGRTICTGVLLMRSSAALEMWWGKMSQVAHLPFTDQGLVNMALKSLKVNWDKMSPLNVDRDMHGICPGAPQLRAVLLSEEKMCRYSCEGQKRGQYYVWHKPAINKNRTVENKRKRAQEGDAWLLREDWVQVSKMNSLTGVTWLLAISQNA